MKYIGLKSVLLILSAFALTLKLSNAEDYIPDGASGNGPPCWQVYVMCTGVFAEKYNNIHTEIDSVVFNGLHHNTILKAIGNYGAEEFCQDASQVVRCFNAFSLRLKCWNSSHAEPENSYGILRIERFLCSANDQSSNWRSDEGVFLDPRPEFTCRNRLLRCRRGFANKFRNGEDYVVRAIKDTGFNEVCQMVVDAISCAVQSLLHPDCDNLNTTLKKHTENIMSIGEYICIERSEDVSEHWDCLLDSNVIRSTMECRDKHGPPNFCDVERIAQCASDSVASNSEVCQPGAARVAYDVTKKSHGDGCQSFNLK